MKPLLAFHNDPKIKAKYLRRVRAHKGADEIINGRYCQNGRGCAVGCTIHSGDHAAYEAELGIPRALAQLEDFLFEALYCTDPARAKEWPELFLSSIKTGRNLELVWPMFAHWLLVDSKRGVIRFSKSERTTEAIQRVAALCDRWISGNKPSEEEWFNAAVNASAAAVDAADAAAAAVDDIAADVAAAAAYTNADAAYAASDAASAAAAADNEHCGIMANKLIELLKDA